MRYEILWKRIWIPLDLETWNLILQHSIQCGAGTSMYLLINSTIVVVIRGPRATLWGSVYLDDHGEEDRDLKWVDLDLWHFFEINHETTPEVVTHLNKEIQRNMNLCYSLFNIYISWVFLWLLLKSLSLFYGLVNIKSHLVRNYLLTCEGNYSCNTISPN